MTASRTILALTILWLVAPDARPADKPDEAWKTRVPPITAERWQNPPPPIPEPRELTRETYRKLVEKFRKGLRKTRLANIDDPTKRYNTLWARREAFLYSLTGKEQYATNAMKFLRNALGYWTEGPGGKDGKTNARVFIAAGNAYREIRQSPSLTEADHQAVRKLFLAMESRFYNWEQGAQNRATAGAGASMILMHFVPDAADMKLSQVQPGRWSAGLTHKEYARKVWDQWYRYRDNDENSAGYNALWFSDLLSVLHITGQEELLKDPGMKRLAERYLLQVCPLGAMPAYGDATSFNPKPVMWIAIFEKLAAVYQDGRFKWAARRMTDYYLRHEEHYAVFRDPYVEHLIDAYQWADPDLSPTQPTAESRVTYRHAITKTPKKVQRTGRWFDLSEETIPNKVIFRTGWGPADAYAMIELCPPVGHGHRDTGAITSLVSDGSVLLYDTPYLIKDHRYHDGFVMIPDQRPKGWSWHDDTYHGDKSTVTVEDFHAKDGIGYARVRITNYMNLDCDLVRRVFFLGEHGLWVRDTIAAGEGIPAGKAFRGRLGPAFNFVGLHPKRGENWVNGCQQTLPGADIWKPKYMIQLPNRPWDLLVWFSPKDGAELVVDDVTFDDSGLIVAKQKFMNNLKHRVWQQMPRLTAGQPETFDSVLVPHRPVADPTPLAAGISILLDEGPDRAVIQIAPSPGTVLVAGINAEGKPLKAGPVETDARFFVVRFTGSEPADGWQVEGTTLKVNGKDVARKAPGS